MKRLALLSVLATVTLITFAQSRVNFTLNTRCEYIIHKDSVKTYYVFPYEGESQSALYNAKNGRYPPTQNGDIRSLF